MALTFSEYRLAVLDELEERNFDKLIDYYAPPTHLTAIFILAAIRVHHMLGQSVWTCADTIIREFNEVAEGIFPSVRI